MESEAATRYAEIGERMRREGDPALASVFERLSADEMGHLDSVVHWSNRTQGRNPIRPQSAGKCPRPSTTRA
jgi:rubrerythrin